MNRRHFLAAGAGLVVAPALAAPAPKKKGGLGLIAICRWDHDMLLTEDGKEERDIGGVERDKDKQNPYSYFRISPDGKRLAWRFQVPKSGKTKETLCVRDFDGKGWGEEMEPAPDGSCRQVYCWLGGHRLVTSRWVEGKGGGGYRTYDLLDVTTGKFEKFDYPKLHLSGVSANGQVWLLSREKIVKGESVGREWSVRSADGKVESIVDDDRSGVTECVALAPDGTAVVYARFRRDLDTDDKEPFSTLHVKRVGDDASTRFEVVPRLGRVRDVCWSPDGKRLAYSFAEIDQKATKWTDRGVCTLDADGKNHKHILTCPADTEFSHGPWVTGWY